MNEKELALKRVKESEEDEAKNNSLKKIPAQYRLTWHEQHQMRQYKKLLRFCENFVFSGDELFAPDSLIFCDECGNIIYNRTGYGQDKINGEEIFECEECCYKRIEKFIPQNDEPDILPF